MPSGSRKLGLAGGTLACGVGLVMRGTFISFEGVEGSGKSTQMEALAKHLSLSGYTVRTLREPGGTALGEEIRHLLKHNPSVSDLEPESELLLINASRAELVRKVIRPAIAAGEVVLSDRYHDSTLAYQGYGRELGLEAVEAVVRLAVEGTYPDLTLLFEVPTDVSQLRQKSRQAQGEEWDRFEAADAEFFTRVAEGYTALARAHPERIRVLDGTRSVEAVAEAVRREIMPCLPP